MRFSGRFLIEIKVEMDRWERQLLWIGPRRRRRRQLQLICIRQKSTAPNKQETNAKRNTEISHQRWPHNVSCISLLFQHLAILKESWKNPERILIGGGQNWQWHYNGRRVAKKSFKEPSKRSWIRSWMGSKRIAMKWIGKAEERELRFQSKVISR